MFCKNLWQYLLLSLIIPRNANMFGYPAIADQENSMHRGHVPNLRLTTHWVFGTEL